MTQPTNRSSVWIVVISLTASLVLTIASIAAWLNAAGTPLPDTAPQVITELPLRLTSDSGEETALGVLRVTATTTVAPGNNAYVQLILDALANPSGSSGRQPVIVDSRVFTEAQRLTARLECPTTAFAECTEPRQDDRISDSGRFDWTWLLTPTAPSGDQPMTLSVFRLDENGGESTIYSLGFSMSISRPAPAMGFIVAAALAGIATVVLFGGLVLARLKLRETV